MLAVIILCLLLTWLICAGVCIGIGSLLLRWLSFTCQRLDGWSDTRKFCSASFSEPAGEDSNRCGGFVVVGRVGVRTFLRLPKAKLTPHQTTSGLTVHVPVETNQCWDAPLPCSLYFHDMLYLRQPGKLERRFASEESGAVVKLK